MRFVPRCARGDWLGVFAGIRLPRRFGWGDWRTVFTSQFHGLFVAEWHQTEHDFNLEKQMLVTNAKLKMREEFEHKKKELQVQMLMCVGLASKRFCGDFCPTFAHTKPSVIA
jgi:hypothetical protein